MTFSCAYQRIMCSTAPSPPRMLTVTRTPAGNIIELNWLPPLHTNGAIHYEIEYEPAVTPGDPVNAGSSSSPYFTLTLPNKLLSYTVRVRAVNSRGSATSGDLVVYPGKSRSIGVCYTRNYKPMSAIAESAIIACVYIIGIQLTISCTTMKHT